MIEVQDPDALLTLCPDAQRMLREHIRQLRFSAWKIWLDDLTYDVCQAMKESAFWFDGVKTDRKELRCGYLPALVEQARHLGRQVLVEGIETDSDLCRARTSGAEWGQGFLWPERQIGFNRG